MVTMGQCHYNETIGFFYNNSGKELSPHWRPKDVVVVALGLTVSVLVLLTNLLVIAAIASNRRFHQPIYYLLGNLAAADLFAGVAYLFLMFHTGPRTARLSLKGWFLRQGLLDTSLTASVATLLAIAVERHRSVMAVQLHSRLPRGRVVLLIVGVWVAALGLGLLPAHSWHCLCALDRCSRMAPLLSRTYLAVWALSSLLVFLLMVAVYTRIFFYVRRRVQRMAEHVSCHPRYRETTLSLVKTVVIILGKWDAPDPGVGPPEALGTVTRRRGPRHSGKGRGDPPHREEIVSPAQGTEPDTLRPGQCLQGGNGPVGWPGPEEKSQQGREGQGQGRMSFCAL